MKKVIASFFVLLVIFTQDNFASATSNDIDPYTLVREIMQLDNGEIERLKGLGFTEEEINVMTVDEYERQDGLYGQVVEEEEKWIRISSKDNTAVEISKDQALNEINNYEKIQLLRQYKKAMPVSIHDTPAGNVTYTDFEPSSWMNSTGSVIKYTNASGVPTGKYRFKYDFNWKTDPLFTLTDGLAITYSPYFTYIQNTEYFKYTYDRYWVNYLDTKNVIKYTAEKKTTNTGIGFTYNLLSGDNNYTVRNNRGSMYFDAELANNNYISGNVFGHYGHTEIAIVGGVSIGLGAGSFSLSGATKVTYMTDTAVSFSTR